MNCLMLCFLLMNCGKQCILSKEATKLHVNLMMERGGCRPWIAESVMLRRLVAVQNASSDIQIMSNRIKNVGTFSGFFESLLRWCDTKAA